MMKIQLLLILKLLFLLGLTTVNASKLHIGVDEMWSVDGGVFHPANHSLPQKYNHISQIMVKDINGKIRIVELPDVPDSSNQVVAEDIFIDRSAPKITMQWQMVKDTTEGIRIGPNSLLNISVDEFEVKEIWLDDEIISQSDTSNAIEFHQPAQSVRVMAQDKFGNTSHAEIKLLSDFQAPTVNWTMMAPAIQTNDQWFAGNSAVIELNVSDPSDVGAVHLNDQVLDWQGEKLMVNLGDRIQVSDTLGNHDSHELIWLVDSEKPKINLQVNDQPVDYNQVMTVHVNDLIEMTTHDAGVGIKTQKYKGKTRKWKELPKKFRFISKGRFRIQVDIEDKVGNQFDEIIKFRVKR